MTDHQSDADLHMERLVRYASDPATGPIPSAPHDWRLVLAAQQGWLMLLRALDRRQEADRTARR